MFIICENGDNGPICDFVCVCLHQSSWSCLAVLCKILLLFILKIYSWFPLSQTWLFGKWVLYYCSFVSFSAHSSAFLAATFVPLICLSKYCPWLFPFHHFYCFLLSGHFVWWHLCNTSHSLISSMSCLITEKPCCVCAVKGKKKKKKTCPSFL